MADKGQVQHFINTIPDPNLVPGIAGEEIEPVRNNGSQLIERARG